MRLLDYLQSNIEITRLQFGYNDPDQCLSEYRNNIKSLLYLMDESSLELKFKFYKFLRTNADFR